MSNGRFIRAAKEVARNAQRLLDEAEFLEYGESCSTRYFLSVIAQEEYAKSFLLLLASRQVIPWSPFIKRAITDHASKQLLVIVLDFLSPNLEVFLGRMERTLNREFDSDLPASVADALYILRHEKIGRWESQSWEWAEDPEYDRRALRVADGKRDRVKQDALYVKIGQDGSLGSVPNVERSTADQEYERGRRIGETIESFFRDAEVKGLEWDQVERAFSILFAEE